jgi:hypothetical protein
MNISFINTGSLSMFAVLSAPALFPTFETLKPKRMKRLFYFLAAAALFVTSAFAQVITVSTLTTGLNRPVVITNSGLPVTTGFL